MAAPVLRLPCGPATSLWPINRQKPTAFRALGFLNPTIYPLALTSAYDTDFHDITSGSNGYSAVVGYDLATGWGSMNGAALINAPDRTADSQLLHFCLARFGLRGAG